MTAVAQPPGTPLATAGRSSRWGRLRLTRAERRGLRTGLLFIAPWLIGFLGFTLYPALASLYYSFTNFKILQDPKWIGLGNYTKLINDPLFWKSLTNTLYLTVIGVPLAVIVALGIALLFNTKGVRGIGVFRTIFYLPVVILGVAAALLFNLITGAIAAFQSFVQAFVVGAGVGRGNDGSIGGVQNSLLFYGLNLYNNGFRYFQMGYASALAWILLIIILIATLLLLRASRNRVYYESGQ